MDTRGYIERIKDSLLFRKKKIVIITFFFTMLLFAVSYLFINYNLKPVSDEKIQVAFEVEEGQNAKQIAEILKEKNLIKNSLVFYLYAKWKGYDTRIKAGEYILSPSMTSQVILLKLVKGETFLEKVTIPEGSTINEIARIFEEKRLVKKEEFLKEAISKNYKEKFDFLKPIPDNAPVEGFLYPDTYFFPKNRPATYYIEKLIKRFQEVYYGIPEVKILEEKLNMNTLEVVTLASIIEEEAKIDREKPVISAVFHNRLSKNIPLQSCATIEYILDEHKEKLTIEDLKKDSPYNTYLYKGLPPGPISSPGYKAIIAALKPEKNDYLYFVSNGDGSHTFTSNYQEHLKAKNKQGKNNK
ncbi:endolytic transglycosylase MltG [Thermovenabulum sp.]|uniref:endolytic transglycosylase MltG n=1 Tax=Thermovenabulum sp. TaxID=3100335 RepID=UPI003C7A7B4A